jgi:hypothetical protein
VLDKAPNPTRSPNVLKPATRQSWPVILNGDFFTGEREGSEKAESVA